MNKRISRDQLHALIQFGNKPTLIETLPPQYYAAEHLPGAINVPHDQVELVASQLVPDKNEPVIVYCANAECKNSSIAADTLRSMGYSRVYEYTEGKNDWKAAGLPFESGKKKK